MVQSSSNVLDALNESQRKAVTHIDGPLLILAGPGSGKTRVVTHRIAHLLEQGVSPYSILALTFTNKAASEMKKRVANMVGDAPVWMGTFHGYCVRFLRRFGESAGLAPNFSIFDADDASKAFKKAIDIANVSTTHLNVGDLARRIGALKNRAINPEMFEGMSGGAQDKVISKLYPVYQKVLQQNNAVDFDDLLMHTACILRNNPDLRAELDEKHKYVLVDEYQDTNIAQYLIVRGLSLDHPNINVTGDPDQSIYSWRGADISNILNFERDYPHAVTVRLEDNYRSTPQILSVADSLIACNTRRKAKILKPQRKDGMAVRLCTYVSDRDEADEIAQSIALEILENGAKGKDFAILYRTNAQSRLLEQALLKRKLGYQLIGGFRFYQREEIKDLLAYLRLVNNPTDDVSFDRIINVPTRGLGDKTLGKVADLSKQREIPMLVALRAAVDGKLLSKKATEGARQFLKIYHDLVEMQRDGLLPMIEFILSATNYIEYITARKSESPDDSIVGNINELKSDASHVDSDPDNEGNGLERFLEQITLSSDVDNMTDAENKVTLMTLHAAKGLEYDNVFIIALEDGVLPHIRTKDDPNQLEEERRLFFVGITRAKNRLQLSMAKQRGFASHRMSPASPFLLELPRGEMEKIDKSDFHFAADDFDSNHFDSSDNEFESEFQPFEDEARLSSRSSVGSKKRKTVLLSNPDNEDQESMDSSRPSNIGEENEFGGTSAGHGVADKLNELKRKLPAIGLRSAAMLPSTTTKEGVEVELFEIGSIVRHPEYGIGQVEMIDGKGARKMARVSFENGKEASFQLNKSSLQLIES
jgi:DNA helicase-2/ATP-dependent DNA helicase PcrA